MFSRWFPPKMRLFWLLCLILLVLEFLVRSRTVSPAIYAAPSEIVVSVPKLFLDKGFLIDLAATTGRTLAGLGIGFPLGVALALALYSFEATQATGELFLDFVRSIPLSTLIPLFLAIYGIGDGSKIAIAGFSALAVAAITVWVGIKEEQSKFWTLIKLYRPNRAKRVFLIILPYVLPSMVAALKLSASSALVLVIVSEMFIGTRYGIGKVINDMVYTDNRAYQYAAILCAGFLGFGLNKLIEWIRLAVLRKFYAF